ncbi:unnamed protein product [Pleuronectes platessa]|uniref:Uncharacterized protein n=1 Tax=Pleuronectes platessa TaxID=8262 RepID=A0A9N7TSX8_PLEPL|nr:unnamed protein product [Pleuronectes platessa]
MQPISDKKGEKTNHSTVALLNIFTRDEVATPTKKGSNSPKFVFGPLVAFPSSDKQCCGCVEDQQAAVRGLRLCVPVPLAPNKDKSSPAKCLFSVAKSVSVTSAQKVCAAPVKQRYRLLHSHDSIDLRVCEPVLIVPSRPGTCMLIISSCQFMFILSLSTLHPVPSSKSRSTSIQPLRHLGHAPLSPGCLTNLSHH